MTELRTQLKGWNLASVLAALPGGGGTPSLRVSRYAPRFCPPFSASGRSFCPPKFDHVYYFIQILLGPISKPTFSACRCSFCPPNWPNLSFYSDLVGSCFELRAAHPYWFWPGVPPPPWGKSGAKLFPKPMMTKFANALTHHRASICDSHLYVISIF